MLSGGSGGGGGRAIQRLGFTYLDDSIPEDFRQVLSSLGWWWNILPEFMREGRKCWDFGYN